jgi:hypothetical protein
MTLNIIPGEHQAAALPILNWAIKPPQNWLVGAIARGPYQQQHYNSHEFGRDRERTHSE